MRVVLVQNLETLGRQWPRMADVPSARDREWKKARGTRAQEGPLRGAGTGLLNDLTANDNPHAPFERTHKGI
jgi:hypothetical protein